MDKWKEVKTAKTETDPYAETIPDKILLAIACCGIVYCLFVIGSNLG